MWQLAAGGGILGLLKAYRDQQNEKGARELAAVTAKYSPWTGMQPKEVKKADYLGSAFEGALGGASLGQNIDMADAYSDNLKADTALKTQTALNEKIKAMDDERSKNAALYFVPGADGTEAGAKGLAVTNDELAKYYEDDPSPWVIENPKKQAFHPPMALPRK